MAVVLQNQGGPNPNPNPNGISGGSFTAVPDAAPSVPTVTQPAPSAPSYAPSVQTSAGYTPDYLGLIKSDPGYLAAQSAAQAAASTAAAQRRQQIQQAVIRYGKLPTNFTDSYGDIDQATLDAANGNQQSTIANMHTNYQQSMEQFRRALAARGALQSGDLNYGQDQLDRGEAQQEYDAGNSFLDTANSNLSSYAGQLNANSQSLVQAILAAEANVYANPAYRPTQAQTANYDPSSSTQYGRPLYSDGNGGLYGADGQPYTGPAPTVQTPDVTAQQRSSRGAVIG